MSQAGREDLAQRRRGFEFLYHLGGGRVLAMQVEHPLDQAGGHDPGGPQRYTALDDQRDSGK